MHWHPIDTAPKDGTTVLLCHEKTYDMNGFAPIAAKWRTYHPNAKGEPEWRDTNGTRFQGMTHWMPLPASPTEQTVGGDVCDVDALLRFKDKTLAARCSVSDLISKYKEITGELSQVFAALTDARDGLSDCDFLRRVDK